MGPVTKTPAGLSELTIDQDASAAELTGKRRQLGGGNGPQHGVARFIDHLDVDVIAAAVDGESDLRGAAEELVEALHLGVQLGRLQLGCLSLVCRTLGRARRLGPDSSSILVLGGGRRRGDLQRQRVLYVLRSRNP